MAAAPLERLIPPLQGDAWRVMPWFALGTLILFWLWVPLGWAGLAFMIWSATLFREPSRAAPFDGATLVGPLDGTVTEVGTALPPVELGLDGGERRSVSIVPGPLDSHVLRVPAEGKLVRLARPYPGDGDTVAMRIAGPAGETGIVLVAEGPGRRVRLSVGEGQTVKLGETMGVLLFAGRADVYLPSGAEPGILSGQRVIGGETILGGGATPPG